MGRSELHVEVSCMGEFDASGMLRRNVSGKSESEHSVFLMNELYMAS